MLVLMLLSDGMTPIVEVNMELVIKTYNNQFSTDVITQIQEVDKWVIEFDINNFGTAELTIPIINGINKFDKVEVYEVTGGLDTLVFTGYIFDFRITTEQIVLICRSVKELLNYKLVLSDKSYTNQTITTIIEDILGDWNTAYWDFWTFFSADTSLISKDFKTGDNLYDIIEELAGVLWLVWDVIGNQIEVKELIGEDKTSVVNYKEFFFNGNSQAISNISEPILTSYPTLRNVVIGIDWTTKSTKSDTTSINEFWSLGEIKSFRDWELATQTQEYLDSKKDEQKIFNFDAFDVEWLNIGDKIKLFIENTNEYLDFEWDAIINTQKIEYLNRDKIVSVWVSSIYVYQDTLWNKIRQIDKNIKLLTV